MRKFIRLGNAGNAFLYSETKYRSISISLFGFMLTISIVGRNPRDGS